VGSATGISAGALTAHPVEAIDLIEIVPGVARAAARFFRPWNRGVHQDPRVRTVVDDARNALRVGRERYDVVVADLFVPWRAGESVLFAREHFEAVRDRLTADGVFCQWLPLYQLQEPELRILAATFLDVFPRAAVFRGDFFGRHPIAALVGYRGRVPTEAEVGAAAARLAGAGETDRWVGDPAGVWSLYVGPLTALAPELSDTPRNTDARPRIEFLAPRGLGPKGVREPIVGLRWTGFVDALRDAARRRGDSVYPDLSEAARRASEGGTRLQQAGALWELGRRAEAARALTAARELLPPRLLNDAPPDPTAASVWVEDR
jgi:spermidine synthase